MKKKANHECVYCDRPFKSAAGLASHLRWVHGHEKGRFLKKEDVDGEAWQRAAKRREECAAAAERIELVGPKFPRFDLESIGEALAQDEQARPADPVNRPPHYTAGGVECIEAIQASMSGDQFRGYCKGAILKYLWRWEHKGGLEDLQKAEWYLKRLIGTVGPGEGE